LLAHYIHRIRNEHHQHATSTCTATRSSASFLGLTATRSHPHFRHNRMPGMKAINQQLQVASVFSRRHPLTDSSLAMLRGTATVVRPCIPYALPAVHHAVVRSVRLPWHVGHYESNHTSRQLGPKIESFILILQHDGVEIIIPMEVTILVSCAICAILRKISPYCRDLGFIQYVRAVELYLDESGRSHTVCVELDHGKKANDVLHDFLETILPGDIVRLRIVT
jgi:hypothetical protein